MWHNEYVRMTVDIPDHVYRRLKSRADSEGSSAKEVILRAVQLMLKDRPRKSRKRVKLPLIKSKQPGTLELDNDKIFDIISFAGH
jgi:Arc/MetJ-type ribon-helix-helix transcriptional regulator